MSFPGSTNNHINIYIYGLLKEEGVSSELQRLMGFLATGLDAQTCSKTDCGTGIDYTIIFDYNIWIIEEFIK